MNFELHAIVIFILFSLAQVNPVFTLVLIIYLFALFFLRKHRNHSTSQRPQTKPHKTPNKRSEFWDFYKKIEEIQNDLNDLQQKSSYTEQEKEKIRFYLDKLEPLVRYIPEANRFYHAFQEELKKNQQKAPSLSQEPIKPIPKPATPSSAQQPQKNQKPLAQPETSYHIIKDITQPKFTSPPPPNHESTDKGSETAQQAQSRLNVYMGIFEHRPNYRRRLSNREKGSRYEHYLGYLYERAGWEVEYHGETQGVYDCGIDLICITRDHTHCHLVQAKAWKRRQIDTQDIRKFIDDFHAFKHSVNHHAPQAVLMTSSNLTPEAKHIAQENHVLFLEKLSMPDAYPLVKCITTQQGKRYYLLPPRLATGKTGNLASYVHVSVNFTQGDTYVYTCAEAERLGYTYEK